MSLAEVMVIVFESLLLGAVILLDDAPQLEEAWVVKDTAGVFVMPLHFDVNEYSPDATVNLDNVSILLVVPLVTTIDIVPNFMLPPVPAAAEISAVVVFSEAVKV
ncbi:MAG: hypothetical protein J5902_02365 [Paludibacteraceae bacterium]|nr:hypothetical protein [Paludibacteraceae bacterium]